MLLISRQSNVMKKKRLARTLLALSFQVYALSIRLHAKVVKYEGFVPRPHSHFWLLFFARSAYLTLIDLDCIYGESCSRLQRCFSPAIIQFGKIFWNKQLKFNASQTSTLPKSILRTCLLLQWCDIAWRSVLLHNATWWEMRSNGGLYYHEVQVIFQLWFQLHWFNSLFEIYISLASDPPESGDETSWYISG